MLATLWEGFSILKGWSLWSLWSYSVHSAMLVALWQGFGILESGHSGHPLVTLPYSGHSMGGGLAHQKFLLCRTVFTPKEFPPVSTYSISMPRLLKHLIPKYYFWHTGWYLMLLIVKYSTEILTSATEQKKKMNTYYFKGRQLIFSVWT